MATSTAVITHRSYGHLIYALISGVCPIIAFLMISMYQSYACKEYTPSHDSPMADLIQAMFAVGVGSLVGLVFAGLSFKYRFRLFSFGTAVFLFNFILVVLVLYFSATRSIRFPAYE